MKQSKPIRWNQETAAREFGINPRTLAARFRQQAIEPGSDGKFTTQQICAAVYGDFAGEKLGKLRAERQLAEFELAQKQSQLLEVDVVDEMWQVADANIKEQVVRLPTTFESRHQEGMTGSECRVILEKMVDEICEEISKPKSKPGRRGRVRGEPSDPVAKAKPAED